MGTKLILARHGETLWNRESRFQGSKDIEITDEGKEQAEKLAERFQDEKIDAVYASDLSRAYQTAKLVAKGHDLTVEQVSGLREIHFGNWEGMMYEEIEQESDFTFTEWLEDPVNRTAPEGEGLRDVQKRSLSALKKIIDNHPDETVFIVTHGGVIRVLVSTLLDMPLDNCWQLNQANTSVNILDIYDQKVILDLFNCTAHLG